MYEKPTPRAAVPSSAKVVCPIWNYSQKGYGIHKARKCMNGKQLLRMGVKFWDTYKVCMERHCLHLITDGDIVNAYVHTSTEGTLISISVYDVFFNPDTMLAMDPRSP
jgi:hypothetical protein